MAKILIADDDPMITQLVEFKLKNLGHEVFVATNGEEALELVKKEAPSLVLLDWMMPKMDGVETARALRADKTTKHIPIIMLTAKTGEADVVEGLETGADDYIKKPFSVQELAARIKRILDK